MVQAGPVPRCLDFVRIRFADSRKGVGVHQAGLQKRKRPMMLERSGSFDQAVRQTGPVHGLGYEPSLISDVVNC